MKPGNEIASKDVLAEAEELARLTEILPNGVNELAKRIQKAKDEKRPLRVKLGIDPTSADLHLGHAVVFRKLKRFQEFGHQVVLIIGGFTAQIGDPSGRNSTRPPLTAQQVNEYAETYLNQMGVILDLDKTEVVNNFDWLSKMTFNEVLKLAGLVTVSQLLAKEAFGDRLEKQSPVGLHELFYPILQGYDSVAIKCDIELGGTDQRFNILQGRELQPHFGQTPQIAMFLPLLEGTDGVKKMSKTYDNYIGLKETPDDMFGKCMRIPDNLIIKFFELTTILSGSDIDNLASQLKSGANPKDLKEKLAHQIVFQYHGKEAAEKALAYWQKVHSQRQLPDEMPIYEIPRLTESLSLAKLLSHSNLSLAASGSEAKRLIQEGAVRVDGKQETNPNMDIMLTSTSEFVVQVGKRKFLKVKKT